MKYTDESNPFIEIGDEAPVKSNIPSQINISKEATFWTPKGEFRCIVFEDPTWPGKFTVQMRSASDALYFEQRLEAMGAIKFVRSMAATGLIEAKAVIDAIR